VDVYEHLLLENELRGAVERDELRLHYQPQVDLASGEFHGIEALVRWEHPRLGLLMPGRFIPLAEEAGIIGMIGEWVLREACRQVTAWDAQGMHVPLVAVNLSVRQVERDTLLLLVSNVLHEAGLASHRLELEVTESIFMRETQWVDDVIQGLWGLGVSLAIDDFGTGYSSLGYLNRLPVHRLKIDQGFVRSISEGEKGESIVRAIIALGRSLGLETVAEGIEEQSQADFLLSEGCLVGQGYLYSHPLAADALFQSWSSAVSADTSKPYRGWANCPRHQRQVQEGSMRPSAVEPAGSDHPAGLSRPRRQRRAESLV
jgi:EAL domain-containing protein (putative c-di-GMP-specific phosphodiesterase class I)